MAGAFSCAEANAAAKLLGFPALHRPPPMDAVRLLCVNHFTRTFTTWNS